MIWESSVLIIHNSKMYENLNVEKAERIKKQQNTHGWGKVSLRLRLVFLFFSQ